MSRVGFSKKGNLVFYIDEIEVGSFGYMIDYTKGDSSRGISHQCKIKVVDYMVFGTEINSKRYFIELKRRYCGKSYKQFILHYSEFMIIVCIQKISDWEMDLLTKNEINHIILFENTKFQKRKKIDMITFNTD